MKLCNWSVQIFIYALPLNLLAAQGPSDSKPQIIESEGKFDEFAIGSHIQSGPCVEQIYTNIYRPVSSPGVIFTDETGKIIGIAATGPGIFTQRYVTIGQSTMEDVLRRYGQADFSFLNAEKLIVLSYTNLIFLFDDPRSAPEQPALLSQKVKAITLKQVGSTMFQAGINLINEQIVVNKSRTQCDVSLWNHVYHSNRLTVNQQCICVTGTIVDATNGRQLDGVRREADGDAHGWLKVDSEFENLLNAGNLSAQDGNLVFEIICRYPVRQADAMAPCQGYSDQITLPPVGSHVRILGTYVQDSIRNQWMEIHPVTSVKVVP